MKTLAASTSTCTEEDRQLEVAANEKLNSSAGNAASHRFIPAAISMAVPSVGHRNLSSRPASSPSMNLLQACNGTVRPSLRGEKQPGQARQDIYQ